jgi:NAD(P)-dependent dehydrogenase (short-subunit alcohol dehydrogenase family)
VRICCDESSDLYSELAAAVKETERNVTGVQGDVSNLGDLDRLFAQIKHEKDDSIFNINVKGLLFTVQKALPLMPDGASIILNASIVASQRLAGE